MPENRHLRILLGLLYAALALVGLWLAWNYLLPWLLPFLLALVLSALLEKPVGFLTRRLRLPRWGACALCTALLWVGLLALGALAVWRIWYELTSLLGRLPALLSGLPGLERQAEGWVYRLLTALPVQVRQGAAEVLEDLAARALTLPGEWGAALAQRAARAAGALPRAGLFLFTAALATYFTSLSRPKLLPLLAGKIPPRWRRALWEGPGGVREVLGGWLRAQGLLMLITLIQLAAGLLLLRVEAALVLSCLIALLDALPALGSGMVLLPWALFALVRGDVRLCAGLMILFAAVTLVRSALEPKLVGSKIGLHPLAALLAMYVGFQVLGVTGMILGPLAAILLKTLYAAGLLSPEKSD